MYLGDRIADDKPLTLSPALRVAVFVSLVGILFIGIWPEKIIAVTRALLKTALLG